MKQFIIIIFVCLFKCVSCQQGKNYLRLMNQLKQVDSISLNECYKDGKPKRFGLVKYYKYLDLYYEMNVGKHSKYYKNGARVVSLYDDWGTVIFSQYFDSDNNLISEYTTTEINTDASNLDVFFESKNHVTFKISYNFYEVHNKTNKHYLKKKGQYFNGNRTGKWQFFNYLGALKKEKEY